MTMVKDLYMVKTYMRLKKSLTKKTLSQPYTDLVKVRKLKKLVAMEEE